MGAIPGIAMLVLSVTLPASTGCLSLPEVNSMANAFFPFVHSPDALFSVITTSFAFCVWITFSALHAGAAAPSIMNTLPSITRPIHRVVRIPLFLLSVRTEWLDSMLLHSARHGAGLRRYLCMLGLGAAQIPIVQPIKQHRGNDQDQREGAHHAAQDGRRQRLHYLRAGRVAPHDRQEARHDGGHRHHLGPEPQQRTLLHPPPPSLARNPLT